MPKYLICHSREIRRFGWFEAVSESDAIEKAQSLDNDESDSDLWDTEDNDSGNFEIRDIREPNDEEYEEL